MFNYFNWILMYFFLNAEDVAHREDQSKDSRDGAPVLGRTLWAEGVKMWCARRASHLVMQLGLRKLSPNPTAH